jgi:hypothetical protein
MVAIKNGGEPDGMVTASIVPTTAELRARILLALNDQKFSGRTITGIAAAANVEPRLVIDALKTDPQLVSAVKIAPVRADDGRVLLTTKERFVSEASFKEKFIDFFSSNRVAIDN